MWIIVYIAQYCGYSVAQKCFNALWSTGENIFVLLLSVCGTITIENYPIHLKFCTDAYALCKYTNLVSVEYYLNNTSTGILKYVSNTLHRLEGNSLKSVLTLLLCIKFKVYALLGYLELQFQLKYIIINLFLI